jgi:metal-dependent amidase/aminoacylase/carboxypeptidase family protein
MARRRCSTPACTRAFGRPDFAIAVHDTPELPAGTVGWTAGYALANLDFVDLTIRGRGGHGAYTHRIVDPIVIAACFVTALQTVVARENEPLDPASSGVTMCFAPTWNDPTVTTAGPRGGSPRRCARNSAPRACRRGRR